MPTAIIDRKTGEIKWAHGELTKEDIECIARTIVRAATVLGVLKEDKHNV